MEREIENVNAKLAKILGRRTLCRRFE